MGQHQVNESVAKVMYQALSEAEICTDNMGWVPKPFLGRVGIGTIISALARLGEAVFRGNKTISLTCKAVISQRYRTPVEEALRYL